MKIRKINRQVIKDMNDAIAEEAKIILAKDGVRLALVYALLFVMVCAGTGVLLSSLLFGILQLCSVTVNDTVANIVTLLFLYVFAAPAVAGMHSVTASACRGETELYGLFIAFSSFERFVSAYLGLLIICLRYAVVLMILYIPSAIIGFFDNGETVSGMFYPIAFAVMLIAFALWYLLTAKLGRLNYCLWSQRLPFFKALGASYKGAYISLGVTGKNILYAFLTVVTLFILLVFHTGPLWLLEKEITVQRTPELLMKLYNEKSRKDGQDK